MVETALNMFDVVVISVVGLSALLSFFRGFVREIFSLGAWIFAGIITLYSFPHVTSLIQPHVKNPIFASGFASMGTFIISFLLISIFSSMLMKFMKSGSDIGVLDNLLGLGFGFFRGALLLSLGYFLMSKMMEEKEYPEFIQTAITRPYVAIGGRLIEKVAPNYLSTLLSAEGDNTSPDTNTNTDTDNPDAAAAIEKAVDAIASPSTLPTTPNTDIKSDSPNKGYRWDSMEKLQQLIEENKDNSTDQ